MKKQKGVTMIELVIVLVILLIITTFAVYSGRESVDQATAAEVYTEINSIREATNSINIKKELDEDFTLEKGKHYDIKITEIAVAKENFENAYNIPITDEEFQNLYIIYGMDNLNEYSISNVKNYYGLDSIKHTYLVNFNTGRADLLTTIRLSSRGVRTFEQIRALVDNGEI